MTITTLGSRNQYTSALNSDTVFPITFTFLEQDDVAVYQTPSGQAPNPASDLLQASEYVLVGTGSNPSLRNVTLNTPAPVGDIITVIRNMPLKRTTDFQLSGDFSAANLNNQFDRLVLMVQQVNTLIKNLGLTYVDNEITDQTNPTQNLNTLPKLPNHGSDGVPVWTTNGNGDLISGLLEEDPGASTLRSELANNEDGTDGARLVGYYNPHTLAQTPVIVTLDGLVSGNSGDFVPGDLKPSLLTTASMGWLLVVSGTIGSATSGATVLADASAEDLFGVIWESTSIFDCRIYNSIGVITSKGASASADWAANKAIELPALPGKAVGCSGTGAYSQLFSANSTTDELNLELIGSAIRYPTGYPFTLSTTGSLPGGLLPSTTYYAINEGLLDQIKVAATVAHAAGGTAVDITSAGSGTHTILSGTPNRDVGYWNGEDTTLLTIETMPSHRHTPGGGGSGGAAGATGTFFAHPNEQSGPTGGTQAHNNMQPTCFVNWMIKL